MGNFSSLSSSICSGRDVAHKGTYPLYGSTGIIGTTDKPSHNGKMLLVARVGANAGKLQLINEECGVSDNTLIVKPKDTMADDYLYYYFMHYDLNRFIYGSGQPLITGGMLKTMLVHFGNKAEREKVCKFFSSLDAQISATTSRLASLKQVKEASLQAMFPQEGETVPKIRFKGFQGEWKKVTLDKLLTVNSGRDYKHLHEGNIPVYGTGGYMLSVDRSLSDCDAIGIGRKGTIDKPQFLKSPFWTVDTLFYLTTKKDDNLYFLFNLSQSIEWGKYDESTGLPSLSKNNIEKIETFIPGKEEQQAIASYFTSLDHQIKAQGEKIEKLKQIKAACLDKMFV